MTKILSMLLFIVVIFGNCSGNKIQNASPTQEFDPTPTAEIYSTPTPTPFFTATLDPYGGYYEEDKIFQNKNKYSVNLRNAMNGTVVGSLRPNQYFFAWSYVFDRSKTEDNMWLMGCRVGSDMLCDLFSVYTAEWLLTEVGD